MTILDMTDDDLLRRMRNFEDHFVERKTANDTKDILKTIVAFANSAPVGFPAILYMGVKDSGEIETPQRDLDKLEKEVNKKLQNTYPRIPCIQRVISDQNRQALAVIVYGSENRPHFSGPSYIRTGSESPEASREQFHELISRRNSKVSRILEYRGKVISAANLDRNGMLSEWGGTITIHYCDQFYVTIGSTVDSERHSFPLSDVEISFDDARDRLLLRVKRFA
jgi:Putative DNA-binding domain